VPASEAGTFWHISILENSRVTGWRPRRDVASEPRRGDPEVRERVSYARVAGSVSSCKRRGASEVPNLCAAIVTHCNYPIAIVAQRNIFNVLPPSE
jgi:hypothetical protein